MRSAKQIKPQSPSFAVEWWPIGRVTPYPNNARVIPASAVEKVASSIRAFGWRQPIVVDAEGVIVVGHVRLLAAEPSSSETVRKTERGGMLLGWNEGAAAPFAS